MEENKRRKCVEEKIYGRNVWKKCMEKCMEENVNYIHHFNYSIVMFGSKPMSWGLF